MQLYLEKRLHVLSKLEDNWDSYGSKRITSAAIKSTQDLFNEIGIFPRVDGGLIIEFGRATTAVDIEITPKGIVELGED